MLLVFETYFGRIPIEHRATLHTVIFAPDEDRVTLVWGTSLRCHGKDHKLDRTVVRQKQYV